MMRAPSCFRATTQTPIAFALAVVVGCWVTSCARHAPLFVYRAYQEPQSTQGPYYLRDALVVAPDHASALRIITQAMSEIHPSWSGPLYVSYVGQSEERRAPGLLGGPVWLASTDAEAAPAEASNVPGDLDLREDISVGTPKG